MKLKSKAIALATLLLVCGSVSQAWAHCQVPCGIYDDAARVKAMQEDVTTIEKAFAQIEELSKKSDSVSRQQLVRWVMTKEEHADKLMDTVSNYFLAQRVKAPAGGKGGEAASMAYVKSLQVHHSLIVSAMKAKQFAGGSADELIKSLRNGLAVLEKQYPAEHSH